MIKRIHLTLEPSIVLSSGAAFVRLNLRTDIGGNQASVVREIPLDSLEPLFDVYVDMLVGEMRSALKEHQ